jgi:hypothetical protein
VPDFPALAVYSNVLSAANPSLPTSPITGNVTEPRILGTSAFTRPKLTHVACQSPFCNLAVIVQVLVFFLKARWQVPCEFTPTPLAFKLNDTFAPPTSKVTDLPSALKPSGNCMIAVRLQESALLIARQGAKWIPKDGYDVSSFRRELLKMVPDYTAELIWIMSKYETCNPELLTELMRTPSIRKHVGERLKRIEELIGMRLTDHV